ncbi:DUF3817 domain-containing protein [Corynebacterium sp. 320]|uniref:DUF3817 domain-containing protein n=1 Tax=Corynebacterium zhongnanshanii TaxID=2768834 RepID=A0ABQ6VDK9_9CORY|nr:MULTISPECIES: DUF3817 domain-containing protein [Corynebacterium]KAB1501434.1 DUF3817 domain-containing protein [Corynebacterium sp. 320]KAB1551441.1 DUF3817 domain-containing protein [Corynebacterium sp. 321]KAB1551731.1 DUF3817 domain-containing protein [Corynebacterium sp. 319]KAB3520984.1 DUF3817 domain-containing protein [Corynebacterium zhongnanshanii]KAB3525792.1 DUF3817 domain-containing protein [Corynebacterium sp. 250]
MNETSTTANPIHPERQKRVAKSLKFYSIAAIVTGIWLLILVAEMITKYLILGSENTPEWFTYIGQAHGLFFIIYAITCLDLGTKARWEPGKWITTILAGVIPFLSFIVEAKRRKEVKAAFHI